MTGRTAATTPVIDVGAMAAAEEQRRFATEQALGLDVYNFLYEASAEECSKKQVFGGNRCGTCLVCKAKALEEKLRIRHVQLGWKLDTCSSCRGSGVKRPKKLVR